MDTWYEAAVPRSGAPRALEGLQAKGLKPRRL